MTNREHVHDVLQLLGMAGIIASLVFVGLELRQADEIALV